jgi:ABC-2 type transport system ATP-binding protein
MSDAPAIKVEGLEKRFGDFTAVAGVSFSIRAGETFGFLGPNGAGKSTTIRMLCGLIPPSGGRGTVAGFDIVRETARIREHIGYMSQKFSLYDELTVGENIDFFGGIYGLAGSRMAARKKWVLEMAGLGDRSGTRTGLLPGGWKQRLALGCAILHEPPIVFLDEPTSGVDPESRRRFWDLIHSLASGGVTVLVTTHYMDEAEYCDRIGVIHLGKLIALDSPRGLKTSRMKGVLFEVDCDDPIRANEALASASNVRHPALFGRMIHVTATDEAAGIASVKSALAATGVRVRGIRRIQPTMEDVFASLVEQQEAEAAS